MLSFGRAGHIHSQNSLNFGNRLRVVLGAVIGGDDKFRLSSGKMRTPVRNYAIGAVWGIAAAAISYDGMIRNARRDRQLVHRLYKTVVRLKCVDAVRQAL